MTIPTLPGVDSRIVDTGRIKIHVLETGPADGTPVLFIHGNGSSATFWEETSLSLPDRYRGIALDLRGYGETEPLPVDATRGLGDMVDDVRALVETLALGPHHIVGHSMGGGVVMKVAIAHPDNLRTITLVDTMSPYGYGGSKGVEGELLHEDGAPVGINPDFVRLLAEGERGDDNPMAPRNVMRQFYFKPPFIPDREEALLSSMLSTRVGDDWYPGEMIGSENWPGIAPGERGILPAFSRKYYNAGALVEIAPKPPILWVRGADDQIVSDNAMFDMAALGAIGAVPGYPGVEACPPQPMLQQIRAVLDTYTEKGGRYREVVIEDAGHSPYIEKPEEFNHILHDFLASAG